MPAVSRRCSSDGGPLDLLVVTWGYAAGPADGEDGAQPGEPAPGCSGLIALLLELANLGLVAACRCFVLLELALPEAFELVAGIVGQ